MVLLVDLNKAEFDMAMPPITMRVNNKEYEFPPRLKYPLETELPLEDGDCEIVMRSILEKRARWLRAWRLRYCMVVRYKVTYQYLTLQQHDVKSKNYYYLYYWRNLQPGNGEICAPEIISLNSCVEFNSMNIRLPSGKPLPESLLTLCLKVRPYERPTHVYIRIPQRFYYFRCADTTEFEQWTTFLKAAVSFHSYTIIRRKYGVGQFRSIEVRKVCTTKINGTSAPTFPMGVGYSVMEHERMLENTSGVVGEFVDKS